jgi:hypothetical protein
MNTDKVGMKNSKQAAGILIGNGTYVEVTDSGWTARQEILVDGKDDIRVLCVGPHTKPQDACTAAKYQCGVIERHEKRIRNA